MTLAYVQQVAVSTVRNLATGKDVQLPIHRVGGGEWFKAAIQAGLKEATGLTLQRNAKALRGATVLKVMRVYANSTMGGSTLCLSQARLAEMAGVSEYTARRAQHWLIENGWLVIVDRFKKGDRGWTVVLTIPATDNGGEFSWDSALHPPRRTPWGT